MHGSQGTPLQPVGGGTFSWPPPPEYGRLASVLWLPSAAEVAELYSEAVVSDPARAGQCLRCGCLARLK